MTRQEITHLLNLFMEGQTTEAEEQQLADYFSHAQDIPLEWQPYRELFLSFASSDYDLTDQELQVLTAEPLPAKRKVRPLYWLGAAAAVAAILLVIGNTMLRNEPTHQTVAKTETQEQSTHAIISENGNTPTDSERKPVAKTTANQIAEAKPVSKPEDTYTPPAETDISPAIGTEVATEQAVAHDEPNIAQVEAETAVPERGTKDGNLHLATYSETDLPVINPQNMLYTEEDIRKIRTLQKQALIAEAQQAIEITNYNLKQVEILLAQK